MFQSYGKGTSGSWGTGIYGVISPQRAALEQSKGVGRRSVNIKKLRRREQHSFTSAANDFFEFYFSSKQKERA